MDYKYFKIKISDINDEVLKASSSSSIYNLKRSLDGRVAILRFPENAIPAIIFQCGYVPVDKNVIMEESTQGLWSEQATVIKNDSKDSDGSPLQRIKITTTGWHYQLHGIEFATSKLDSVYSKKEDGTNFGFTTIKCYDINGTQLTTQEDCDANAVMTIVDWEPTHDYEIVGGAFKQSAVPNSDVRLWVVGVPDVPAEMGGNKLFATNVNLKFIGLEEGIKVDGRAPKYMTYSAMYHTNKLRMVLKHNPGIQHNLQVIFEIFKA